MKSLFCQQPNYAATAQWCLEDVLKLKDYDVFIKWCVFLDKTAGEFIPPNKIFISQDLDGLESIRVLFHEIRHYFQFKTGMFDFVKGKYLTKVPETITDNRVKNLILYRDYQNFPWELDANEFALETQRRFWKEPLSAFVKFNPTARLETC